ncbi:MAG: primosomal protein N' [Intestinibacter sp.]|uniref:primosomal protein N' n=1 Tax=Intestinibacter sp. TaxID=1965304 RepID=UPI002A82D0CB|nr:primosomal protein N' [Intestinibacter sp.]MDY4575357.1 primosomal protein N' [Intestinibacter sp.]
MEKYAKVVVKNNSQYTDNLFTYQIPKFLLDEISLGHRVLVPFGKGDKPIEAYVFNITDNNDENIETKCIYDVLDEKPILKREDLELIHWMKNRYLCTYMDCINLIIPKGYKLNNYKVVTISQSLKDIEPYELYDLCEKLSESKKFVFQKVLDSKGKIKLERLIDEKVNDLIDSCEKKDKKSLKNQVTNSINSLLYKMKEESLIDLKWEYKSIKNEIKICYVSLKMNYIDLMLHIKERKIRLGDKQRQVIEFLKNNQDVEINDLMDLLNVSKASIKSLEEKNLVEFKYDDFYRRAESNLNYKNKDVVLNEEQNRAIEKITGEMFDENKKPYMIHGVTGSGKTEVYKEIIDYALKQGLDSIVLVPEISLTPQTIARFKNKFKDIVGVFHSKLSEGERHDVFREIKKGNIRILIGARSAIFAPFNSLGVVIVDEFHESSYKSESNPKFSTIEVGRYLVNKRNITLVMGSATPSVEEYYRAKNDEYELIELTKRANNKPLPKIEVVDMKDELKCGNRSFLSNKLRLQIEEEIKNKNQVILFLNRRGYSSFVSCRECGYVFKCKNCDISLTYHKSQNIAKCHYCGYEAHIPKTCPECGSKYVKEFGLGTEKIEEEIKNMFAGIRVLRIDKDTTSKKNDLENILNKFQNREADILVGTQMISKGLDFKHVTLVGILSADMMLNFPDFKSFENTFQLVTQVSGRAGRSEKEGKVILQTYSSESSVIKRIVDYDFKGFYEDEIKIRKLFNYTPFNNMLSVVVSGKRELQVKKNIFNFYNTLVYLLKERGIKDFNFILGPNPCSISRINSNYRWQILFKDDNIEINLLKGIIKYICITKRDIVFEKEVNISIDINPNSIL